MDNSNVTDERVVENEESYWWLKFGDIKAETESTIVAAQGQAVSTHYFKNKMLKKETDCKSLLCKQHEETIDHLTAGCPILMKNKYFMRHDKFCAHLPYSICKTLSIEKTNKWRARGLPHKHTQAPTHPQAHTHTYQHKACAKFLILTISFSRLTKVLLFTDSL